MVPLHDIDVSTKNGKKMRVMLRRQNGGFFVSLQELITDGSFTGLYSEFSSALFKFHDARTAFEYAIKSQRAFLRYAGDDVSGVNNPCNCELLLEWGQRSVLSTWPQHRPHGECLRGDNSFKLTPLRAAT